MKRCSNCGAELFDAQAFCSFCGAPAGLTDSCSEAGSPSPSGNIPDVEGTTPTYYYDANNTGNTAWGGNPMFIPPQPPETSRADMAPVLKTSEWVWTILLTCIPVVNLVMLVIWAASDDTNPNKQNWARANLLIALIEIGVAVVFVIAVLLLAMASGAS